MDGLEVSTDNWEDNELAVMKEHRWWSVAEIADATSQVFVPRRMGELIAPIIAGVVPVTPIETGA